MDSHKTISEIKLSFIRDQIRTLSASLAPNPGWREYGPEVDDDIPDKAVDDVLHKLNNIFRQHNRAVFSTQATHHVVQQIERLYLDSAGNELHSGAADGDGFDATDYSNSETIARLPEDWTEDDASEEDKERYQQLRQRLTELDERRRKQQLKVAQYKHLKSLLEPFDDPQANIQPNLVTRDGQLGEELDRMRMLVAKVAGRIEEAGKDGFARDEQKRTATPVDHDAKLSALLDMT